MIDIGQGTIYLYFRSKEELFEEIRKISDGKCEVLSSMLKSSAPDVMILINNAGAFKKTGYKSVVKTVL